MEREKGERERKRRGERQKDIEIGRGGALRKRGRGLERKGR